MFILTSTHKVNRTTKTFKTEIQEFRFCKRLQYLPISICN